MDSSLKQGNRALQKGDYVAAIQCYLEILQKRPELARIHTGNIELASLKYKHSRMNDINNHLLFVAGTYQKKDHNES